MVEQMCQIEPPAEVGDCIRRRGNRIAMGVSTRAGKTYQTTPATPTSNRVCAKASVCTADEYMRSEKTGTADRDCQPIYQCNSMQYLVEAATPTSQTVCKPRNPCVPGVSVIVSPATNTSDWVCESVVNCDYAVEYHTQNLEGVTQNRICADLRVCSATLQWVSTPPAPDGSGNRECAEATTCKSTEYETKALSTFDDRGCTPATPCEPDHYEFAAPVGQDDRICKPMPTLAPTPPPTPLTPPPTPAPPTLAPTPAPTPAPCATNEHVQGFVVNSFDKFVCKRCPPGTTNAAGDQTVDGNSDCDATKCAKNEHVQTNACKQCAAGTTNAAGDDASKGNTDCSVRGSLRVLSINFACRGVEPLEGCDNCPKRFGILGAAIRMEEGWESTVTAAFPDFENVVSF